MRVLGKRSIASLLKITIDLIWYVAIVLYSMTFVLFIWTYFISGPPYEIRGWPIHLESDAVGSAVSPIVEDLDILEVSIEKAEIGFRAGGDWRPRIIRLVSLIAGGCMGLLVIHNIRRVIGSAAGRNPFIRENVKRLRNIAYLFIGITVFEAIRGTLIASYIRSHFSMSNLDYQFSPLGFAPLGDFIRSFSGHLIFIALMMLVLGEIFRLGLEYKEDSQSIV